MSVRRAFLGFLALMVGLYVVLCLLLFLEQRQLIYYPQPRSNHFGITLLTLPVQGAQVLVSTRPFEGDQAILYFGGNAEDVSQIMPDLAPAFPDAAIYLLHYRGYGGSSGKPSEEALVGDARALFDLVYAHHHNVVVIGRSLGTGVAVQLASSRPVSRLVLVTPFNALKDVAAAAYPYLPVGLLLRDKFDSGRFAAYIQAPTLIVAAGKDELIPRASTLKLSQSFPHGVARMVVIPDVGHNSISENPDYMRLLMGR